MDLGYKCLNVNNEVYKKKNVVISVYVDDLLIIEPDISEINELKKKISSQFTMTDCGPCHHYLGIQITRN